MTTAVYMSLVILMIVVVVFVFRRLSEQRSYIEVSEEEYKQAIDEFNLLYSGIRYVSHRLDQHWREKYQYLREKLEGQPEYFFPPKMRELLSDFKICFDTDDNIRKEFNEEFVERQKVLSKTLFDSLMKYPLDEQQREAILHDEDNTLVIAGAGTGKTTTIMGKIAYLLNSNLAAKEEILLISFSRHAVEDMRKELNKIACSEGVNVQTFNAFGYGVIGEVEGNKPNLLFGGSASADIKAKDLLSRALHDKNLDKKLKVKVANFFLYYIFPQQDVKSFDTLDEYYAYVKSIKLITFQGEIVKSFEELKIANFLYLNNIQYVYESPFDEKLKSAKFTSYKPDFYLPEHNITIEHFGIDKNGQVPKFFHSDNGEDASKKYRKKMEYARDIHVQYDRVLIETYSYEEMSGVLLSNLQKNLKNVGVQMKQRSLDEVLHKITVGKTFSPFIDLVYTFLILVKSNAVSVDYLNELANELNNERVSTFMEIFVYLFGVYEAYLSEHSEIDFNDMIIRATRYIQSGQFKHPYKYILVDEFQDMSIGRYNILKALLDQDEETKLFCVGDDWQSIFRFTGSDISITTSFPEYFGYTHHAKLEATHRFNNKILDYSSEFIQENPAQMKKNLKTDFVVDEKFKALDIRTYEGGLNSSPDQEIINVLEEIQSRTGNGHKTSVLLLGRYNHNKPARLSEMITRFNNSLDIEFLTVHKAKGATFDYSILIDVNAGLLGFPSEIVDDPLLQLVLHQGDSFKNAEERRLFYVALTRAKNTNYILTQKGRESKFIKELQKKKRDYKQQQTNRCPQCHGELVERQGPFGAFYGCKNYPLCDYVLSHAETKKSR